MSIKQVNPKRPKVLVIAPYEGMAKIVSEYTNKHSEVEITTIIGDMESGVRLAVDEIVKSSYDVAISRGETASLLAEVIPIPVLSIPITSADILQTLRLAENYKEQFAFVSFFSIARCVELVSNILQCNINNYIIYDATEIHQLLVKLKNEGISVIIGDNVTNGYAYDLGLNTKL